jgi:putative membrane protein
MEPPQPPAASARVPARCLLVFLAVWVACAVAPRSRTDWFLENLPTFIGVPIAVVGSRRFRFTNRAYVQATVFLVLHTIGSHYTYSEVPLGAWARDAGGLTRNHYDRLVHFAFGLLMLRPIRELGFRPGRMPGRFALFYFSVAGAACWSLLYEVVEWLVASVADPAAGTAYLGTQGDPWDAEKDMALAFCGAVLAAAYEWGCGAEPRRPPASAHGRPPDAG